MNYKPKPSLKQFWRLCQQTANLMVGQGDYQNYLAHMRSHHCGVVPMTEAEFFRYHQNSRYPQSRGKASINRCPC
ncbi:MAG TPA: YbdD/YjiX family protein [Cellvibrionaceae bacterium]